MTRQTETTLRDPAALLAAGLIPPERVAELERVAARYAVSLTPDMAALIDRCRSARSDRAPVRARCGGARHARRRVAPIRSATTRTRRSKASCIAIPTACCSSSCMSARSIAGSASAARWSAPASGSRCRAPRSRRARLHPRASGNLGGHPHRRRSADPVAAAAARGLARARRDRACQDRPRAHPRAGGGAGADFRRRSCARSRCAGKATYVVLHANHPRELTDARARRLCAHRRCRHPDAEPERAAARRQRRCGDARRADARLRREPHQALLPASLRPRARHRASAHLDRGGAGADARPARAALRAVPADLRARHPGRPRQVADRAGLPGTIAR